MEVLAGACHDKHLHDLRGLLGRAELLRCDAVDYLAAAMLYRPCRLKGETVRRLLDFLTAAAAAGDPGCWPATTGALLLNSVPLRFKPSE
jgi:hypothetical protein